MKSYPSIDEAFSDMTFTLGLALTQWQNVEFKLYQLFVFLCGQADERAISIIFHEMPLESKMRAITELVRLRDKKLLTRWDAISKVLFKHKRLRDKLAHWTVGTKQDKNGEYIAWLSPPTTSAEAANLAKNPAASGAIDADSLRQTAVSDFGAVMAQLHAFMYALPDAPTS
jgi:hypothetical protein